MSKKSRPRKGSLQFWPRKRAKKILPSVNWSSLNSDKKIFGFIAYKVGMASAFVKDKTENSLTKNKKIILPVTILECPPLKILSVRFYKNKRLVTEILSSNLDKELRKKIKLPKEKKEIDKIDLKDYDDLRIICYSIVKKTSIKKKPDIIEIALSGNLEEKFNFVKENLNKEISILNFFEPNDVIDVRGVTKGKGLQGPVKRFGISLKQYKSEKGRRKPGSLGPWIPRKVSFRVPLAGQLGFFTRISYNLKIIYLGNIKEKNINPKQGFHKYGFIRTNFILVKGSVPGPRKRALLLTVPLRINKKAKKENYEFINIEK